MIGLPGFSNASTAERVAFEKEEKRNEREVTFDAKHKKVAASDRKLASCTYPQKLVGIQTARYRTGLHFNLLTILLLL